MFYEARQIIGDLILKYFEAKAGEASTEEKRTMGVGGRHTVAENV